MKEHLQVLHGANEARHRMSPGLTVGEVRSGLSRSMGIPADTPAMLDGKSANDDTPIGKSETLEFIQPAGRLG